MGDPFDGLVEVLKSGTHCYNIEKIKKAYLMAAKAHAGQKRDSGEDYITHPVSVAIIIAEYGLCTDTICTALLHDVVEDTDITLDTIKKEFGEDVALLVDGVTKLNKIPYSTVEDQQAENLRKMILAMTKDIRVILIKLADRLHNMRTLENRPEDKRLITSLETMQVYAPLAHRLGMQQAKLELEDISLKYLDPVGYESIVMQMENITREKDGFLSSIKKNIAEKLDEHNIKFKIEGRIKHVYSIYRKLYAQNTTLEGIYDLFAIRVILENLSDCYNVLGILHEMYKLVPGRFKDYISTPKLNMYQSMHTTLIGREGIPFEVQIRTQEMHNTAQYGIAAHWKYKDGIKGKDSLDNKLDWVNNLLEIQQNVGNDPDEFLRSFKVDLFSDAVYVFTPKGDVISLPSGANIIDFAYSIHSAVGNRMTGAKVNGRIVPLDYQLKNGEIIEIITTNAPGHGPSSGWLSLVKTSQARNKIRQYFKKEKRDENIEQGQNILTVELKRAGITNDMFLQILPNLLRRLRVDELEDIYAELGFGGISIIRLLPKIKEEVSKLFKDDIDFVLSTQKTNSPTGIIVEGVENCLIKLARCCSALPGDEVIGFVTKGFGVSVHKKNCINAMHGIEKEPERWLNVSWSKEPNKIFRANLLIITNNNIGVMAEVTTALASMRVAVSSINAREQKDDTAHISISISVNSLDHLNSVINRLECLGCVLKVKRS